MRTAGEGGGNSPPLSLCYAPLHSLTWEIHTSPGRGQQPACLMNTKQNLSLTGELQKSSVFIYSFFSSCSPPVLSCLLPPYFFPPSWHTALHQPIVAPFKKERMGREKQNRAKVWELFLLPLFPSEWFHC